MKHDKKYKLSKKFDTKNQSKLPIIDFQTQRNIVIYLKITLFKT